MIIEPDWTLEEVRLAIYEHADFYFEDICDYEYYNDICNRQHNDDTEDIILLDQHMWESFSKILEDNRKLVYDTCIDYGVNECESYFLSIKFLWSALKKFRGKFYRELNNKDDYNKTTLRTAINALIRRLEEVMPDKKYMFSPAAADGELGYFRKQCAWETARYLAEDTGIIFHAKITI